MNSAAAWGPRRCGRSTRAPPSCETRTTTVDIGHVAVRYVRAPLGVVAERRSGSSSLLAAVQAVAAFSKGRLTVVRTRSTSLVSRRGRAGRSAHLQSAGEPGWSTVSFRGTPRVVGRLRTWRTAAGVGTIAQCRLWRGQVLAIASPPSGHRAYRRDRAWLVACLSLCNFWGRR